MYQKMYVLFSTIFILWSAHIYIASAQTECDLAAVNQCVLLLNSSTSTDIISEGLSTIPPREVLLKLCRARKEYKSCFDPLEARCNTSVVFSMTFGIIDKTLTYLCVDSYNEIVEHERCWNQSEVMDGTVACHEHQNVMIDLLKQRANVMNRADLRTNWCSILENTSDCMTDVVADLCGPTPACIMQTMVTSALSGLADLMTCSLLPDCSYLTSTLNESTSTVLQLDRTADVKLGNGTQPDTTTKEMGALIPTTGSSVNAGDMNDMNNPGNAAPSARFVAGVTFSSFASLCVFSLLKV